MKQQELDKRANMIAEALSGTEGLDALNVFGKGLRIAHEKGCEDASVLIAWYIASMVIGMNATKMTFSVPKGGDLKDVNLYLYDGRKLIEAVGNLKVYHSHGKTRNK